MDLSQSRNSGWFYPEQIEQESSLLPAYRHELENLALVGLVGASAISREDYATFAEIVEDTKNRITQSE